MAVLTAKRVRELLEYSPETGEFRWKVDLGNAIRCGAIAGGVTSKIGKRYIRIRIDGKRYSAHQLAWLITYGSFPPEQIDHIDGNGLNNRLQNLRAVSGSENARNKRRQSHNTSGVTGVCWRRHENMWRAQIKVNGKDITLGYFHDKAEAARVRKEAEVRYEFHPNHGTERPL